MIIAFQVLLMIMTVLFGFAAIGDTKEDNRKNCLTIFCVSIVTFVVTLLIK